MSVSFQAKGNAQLNQQLRVQELVVSAADVSLFNANSGDAVILIQEPVAKVISALFQDDSAASIAPVAAASISIVDSVAFTAGGDKGGIKLASTALAANDCVIVKYIVQE